MSAILAEYERKDSESLSAASDIRTAYGWKPRFGLWASAIRDAYLACRIFKQGFGNSTHIRFAYLRRLIRALKCYSTVLDDAATQAWEFTTALPSDECPLGFYETYICENRRRINPELRKRGLIWKDADRNLLVSLHQAVRRVGDKSDDPTPKEWLKVPRSIRLASMQIDLCKHAIENRLFEGEIWISKHFDFYHFDNCTFRDCDFSNVSFASSVFTRCTFSNVEMVNSRLTAASFDGCNFADVDLAGAMLENVRLWYRNRFSGIRIDPLTRIPFPLLEECELSYELAARNYGLLKSWYSSAGLNSARSNCAYREQYCLSQSYPYGHRRLQFRASWALSGYNERPFRFFLWLAGIIMVFALAYAKIGLWKSNGRLTLLDALYFSIVTFTTLGYGDIAPTNPLGQCLAALEVALGVVGIAYLTALVIRRLV